MHKAPPEPDQAASTPADNPATSPASLVDRGTTPGGSTPGGGGGSARTGAAGLHAGCAWLMRFTAGWVFCAMATAGVSLLEKQRRYGEACDCLRLLLGALRPPLSTGILIALGFQLPCWLVHALVVQARCTPLACCSLLHNT